MKAAQDRCFSYSELKAIKGVDNGEKLVSLNQFCPEFRATPGSEKMRPYVGDEIFVRSGVAQRLKNAQAELADLLEGAVLSVRYGYRHPEIQQRNFKEFYDRAKGDNPSFSEQELLEYVHHYMAIPDVGGHPVGGAIDITIEIKGVELDMGCAMADFSDMSKVHTFSDSITESQQKNRILLRTIMMNQGFAPYDFEWWHFSFGDREWACYYRQESTYYDTIDFRLSR